MRDAAGNAWDENEVKRGSRRPKEKGQPRRSKPRYFKREPFAQQKVAVKMVGKPARRETVVIAGGPPKKLTGGLRKHLIKVLAQNPVECQRQLAMLGLTGDCYKELGLDKPKRQRRR